jgi:hypothetical protein
LQRLNNLQSTVNYLKLYLAEFLLIQLSVPVHIQLVEDLVGSFTYTSQIIIGNNARALTLEMMFSY